MASSNSESLFESEAGAESEQACQNHNSISFRHGRSPLAATFECQVGPIWSHFGRRSPWPSMLEGHGFGEWARPAGHLGCMLFIQVVGAGDSGRNRRKEEEEGGGEVTQFLGHLMSVALEP